MTATWKERIVGILKGWLLSLAIAILIATSFKSSLADWNDIPTGSMQPTILIGDRVFVNKLAYDLKVPYTTHHIAQWSNPKRGEIVVFYSPQDGTRLIKRVIGVPGDVVAMYHNKLFINGKLVEYSGIGEEFNGRVASQLVPGHLFSNENLMGTEHLVMFSPTRPSLTSFQPVTLPEGKYFMMGDNRDNSADSRFFGLVDRDAIVGQATTVVLSRDGSFIHPRWSRFFHKLI